ELAYSQVDPSQQVVLLADSWYPKGEVLDFIKKHDNVEAVLSVKKNTAFYFFKVHKRECVRLVHLGCKAKWWYT
ncbi:MAG: hypothetical protein IJS50_04260, partial [Desulfovibrio sp.]|nr:hypothetical protein [Desulfovibrio sp.]